MIAALVLHIVLHAQMTVPWIGGTKAAAAPQPTAYTPLLLKPGVALLRSPGIPVLLFK